MLLILRLEAPLSTEQTLCAATVIFPVNEIGELLNCTLMELPEAGPTMLAFEGIVHWYDAAPFTAGTL
jgi:hypothetical protein